MFVNPTSKAQRGRALVTANLLRIKMTNKFRPSLQRELQKAGDAASAEFARLGGSDEEVFRTIELSMRSLETPLIGTYMGTGRAFGQPRRDGGERGGCRGARARALRRG